MGLNTYWEYSVCWGLQWKDRESLLWKEWHLNLDLKNVQVTGVYAQVYDISAYIVLELETLYSSFPEYRMNRKLVGSHSDILESC